MRTLLRVTPDVDAANEAIKDGSMPKIIQNAMDKLKPEAAYFHANDGHRSFFMVFDMKDPSEIPVLAEPFFMKLKAKVDFCPVMNADDLKKGLEAVMAKQAAMV